MTIRLSSIANAHMQLAFWWAYAKERSSRDERRFAIQQALAWRAEIRRVKAEAAADRELQAAATEVLERAEYERLRRKFENVPGSTPGV